MAAAKDIQTVIELGYKNDLPVAATTKIYQGSAVGDNAAGYARALVAGDPFRGFAVKQADNTTGAAGDINVNVYHEGQIQLAVTSLAITDVGKYVYASDDNTFSLTESTGTYIGRVKRYVSSGVGIVEFCVDDGADVIAAQAGGETTIANLQTLCAECNLGKSNLPQVG